MTTEHEDRFDDAQEAYIEELYQRGDIVLDEPDITRLGQTFMSIVWHLQQAGCNIGQIVPVERLADGTYQHIPDLPEGGA